MISVIIPVYNAEKYLHRCIQSILEQTYQDFEAIIVNDGSVDSSALICEKLAAQDSRIKLFHVENGGVSRARNLGLKNASGEYCCFVDADDYIDKDFLEQYINIAQQTDADIVLGGCVEERDNYSCEAKNAGKCVIFEGKSINQIVCSLLDCKPSNNNDYNSQVLGYCWCKLYKTEVINRIAFPYQVPIREDAIFNIKAFGEAKKIIVSDLSGYHYVINPSSATGQFRDAYTEEAEKYLNECMRLWRQYQLPTNSYYIGCLYTYMNWLKLYVMHEDSHHSYNRKMKLLRESFQIDFFAEGFEKVQRNSLNRKYKILHTLYLRKSAIGILVLFQLYRFRRGAL